MVFEILQQAAAPGWGSWINLGINLFLSTLVGGVVIAILMAILSKTWHEPTRISHAFLLVLLINIINFFGIIAFLAPFVPAAGITLPIVIWIGLTKLLFPELRWLHAVIAGVLGYVISIIAVPILIEMFAGFLPSF